MIKYLCKMAHEHSIPSIMFSKYYPSMAHETNYSDVYEIAKRVSDNVIHKNDQGNMLSRIPKKNGKHRYYLTTETQIRTCDGCGSTRCLSQYCRGGFSYEYYYTSIYLGKDLDEILQQHFCQ